MARLNEVPAPATESIEALKRRFIRQNREIARVNSNQSIRIRNLETEISRLLAENIALREEAISARTEADKWKTSHKVNKEVLRVKEQLELRLLEVNDLVTELGVLPEKVARRSSQKRRHGGLVTEMLKTEDGRDTRQRNTILEQDGRLPAIHEDKYYPRHTLEVKEVEELVNGDIDQATESPDLGPPPVTHFNEPQSVTFDTARLPRRTSSELIAESEEPLKQHATDIDSKRNRRASVLLEPSAIREFSASLPEDAGITIPEPEKRNITSQPRPILKTGAKRKLEMSELEDTSRVSKELDDFIFQRKANATPMPVARQSRFSRPAGRTNHENTEPYVPISPERSAQSDRRILAPKSTNSPSKRSSMNVLDRQLATKEDDIGKRPERRVISRIRTKTAILDPSMPQDSDMRHKRDEPEIQNEGLNIQLLPKTPAPDVDNVMSPTSIEPSTKSKPTREMAVTNSVEDVLNGSIGRGSRRARAPVNYAQPNLRDKMRRPGKELVGAVEGLVKPQSDSDQERQRARGVSIGTESVRHDGSHLTSNEHTGKESGRWQVSERGQGGRSEPASPLKDKVAPPSRRNNHDMEGSEHELNDAVSRLSLFDASKSSPLNIEASNEHVPKNSENAINQASLEATTTNMSSQSSRTRRPSSALDMRQLDRADEPDDKQRRGHTRKSASVTSLPSANHLSHRRLASTSQLKVPTPPPDPIEPESLDSRTRSSALTRRRSMMV